MSEYALLLDVLRRLDLCVIESSRSKPPVLRPLTPAPAWLSSVFAAGPKDAGSALGAPIPFLDHFLPQAEAAWHEGSAASASSGPFVATVGGEDALLRASAMTVEQHRLLVVQRLTGDADLRPMLQRAREQTLEIERLARQAGALHAPASTIDHNIKALLAAPLAPEHHALVERLSHASAEVQAALATLPAPPRHRRQARTP